jgi:4-hydroxybenzoate polyprenyltransferase
MWHLAAVVGVYIVGVTWFARTEEAASNRRQLMLAAGVMLVAVLGGLLVPIHFAPGTSPWYFPYLVAGFLFYVGTPVVRAIRRPEPKPVQAAVKRSILGLVVLDAVLATAFVGWPGLLILLLLPPALWLGKWVYST